MSFLDELNQAQRQAVVHTEGPSLVIAGAGSGKTRVLTYRIAYLLSLGIPAYNILALTFTNKAAREMKERIKKLAGEEQARYLWMGTFHSICARILRQEAKSIDFTHDFTIYDSADSKSLIKQILKEMQLDEKVYKPNLVLGRISTAKNSMISAQEYAHNATLSDEDRVMRIYRMADIYYAYQNRLRTANAMDFDDLLFNMNVLLKQNEQVRQKYQQVFKYILVDEYQDTNYAQYLIVRTLAEPERNICVVGDDAQSIYSFRGANIENILHFAEQYDGCPIFKLERNYRSTQNIVNAANSLIDKNKGQIQKNVYSENAVGQKLNYQSLLSDRDEATYIAKQIQQEMRADFKLRYNDFAILYRTNAQSRVIEDEMRKQRIPYKIYGGLSFYQRKEIKDAIAYLRITTNPNDDEALLRIINLPARGIGDTTMRKVTDAAHARNIPLLEVVSSPQLFDIGITNATANKLIAFAKLIQSFSDKISNMNAYELAKHILDHSGLMLSAMLDKSQEGLERYQNLQELLSGVHEFQDAVIEANPQATVALTDFLAEVSLLTDQDERIKDNEPRVSLMTVHAAKGLEFPILFIAGMEENLFPSMFAESFNEIEEERRLFYVAITRAELKCFISSAQQRFRNGQVVVSTESHFLKDIDGQYLERQSAAKKEHNYWSQDFYKNFDQPAPEPKKYVKRNMQSLGTYRQDDKQPLDCIYSAGSRVEHAVFGKGTVIEAFKENGNDKLKIRFDLAGEKILLLKFAKLTLL